jgi:amidohydrolase
MAKDFLTEDEKKTLIGWRRDLHKHPELAFQERKTSEVVEKKLSEFGIPFQNNVAGTGVVGLLGGNQGGRILMVRSDMDALPVQEENDVDYKSKHDGLMHACGHDGHMAILLMTAKKMVEEKDFKGTIKFVFQPAEEVGKGAQAMIQDGVMENPKVDGALGLHLWNNLPVGKIGITPGPILAAVDEFVIKIIGKGGHGAVPDLTIDPIVTAGQVINTLQTLVSRSVSPLETVVVTIGAIHGGTTFNVIADEVVMKGTVRTYSMAIRDEMPKRFKQVLAGITKALGASYELDYNHMILPTINDPKMTDLAREVAKEVVGEENIIEGERTMGGEDMSYYLNEVPGCFIFVGSSNESKGINHSHHSSRFNIDEDALPIGVEILTKGIKRYFK